MKKTNLLLLTSLLIIAMSATAIAANRTASVSGNWNSTTTWGNRSVPVAGDNVTINSGVTVTVTAAAACAQITNNGGTLTINGTNTLTVSGTVTINRPSTVNVNAGTLNATSIIIDGGDFSWTAILNITTGTVNVTGNITFTGGVPSLQVITFTSTGTLNVSGTFESDGTLTAGSGTVNFTGTSQVIPNYTYNNLTISGNGNVNLTGITVTGNLVVTGSASVILPPSLSNLTVNSVSGMNLNSALTLSGTLTFLQGNLYLGSNNLTISGSVIGAADGMSIVTNGTGVVLRTVAAAGNFEFPVGTEFRYNPVLITNNDASAQTFTAAVVAGENPVTTDDSYACNRTWNITKTGTSADITFTWNGADAGSNCDASLCSAWRNNGTTWVDMGGTLALGTPNSITLTGVTAFSPWTIGNGGALPVEMTSFTAVLNGSNALLKWSTATENNNSGFQIERSVEGSDVWVKVAFVKGAGTSDAPKYYSYEDKNLAPGAYVYRIKQIDNDGTMTIYNPNELPKVDAGKSDGLKLGSNYPNPFNPSTSMQFSVPVTGHASLKVYNVIGQEVAVLFSGTAQAGHYITATFNASRLASGIYFARLQYNGQSLVQRMLMTK